MHYCAKFGMAIWVYVWVPIFSLEILGFRPLEGGVADPLKHTPPLDVLCRI